MTDQRISRINLTRLICGTIVPLCLVMLAPAQAQLSCTGETGLFDWDDASSTWPAGSLSNSYTADGEPVDITFSGDTGFFLNILGAQTPFRTNALSGGIVPAQQGLLFVYNMPDRNRSVDITIAAGQPGRGVEQLQFTIFDLDTNGPTPTYTFQDVVEVTASLDGSPVTDFTFTTTDRHTVAGNVITGVNASGNTEGLANATIRFNSPVDTVALNYRPGAQSQTDPAQQGMSLHDISFCKRQDFGDAPATYGAPAHTIVDGIYLGTAEPDGEAAASPTTNADGDDTTGADDEGAVSIPALQQGAAGNILVSATGAGGFLQGWIDWNGDGDFNDTVDGQSEQISTDRTLAATTGVISIPVQVPATATLSQTYARFRWSTTSGLDATVAASDGEVEDYALTIAAAGNTISGIVFEDNGIGGSTAHDGIQGGTEAGLGGLVVTLTNAGSGAVLSTGQTGGDGSYQISLPPAAAGQAVQLTISPEAVYQAISEAPGPLPSLVNPSSTDSTLIFTPAASTSYTSINFGQIQTPQLTQDRLLSADPGGLAIATHTYTSTTSASVNFSLVSLDANPASAFASELFLDTNCSGTVDGAEGPVSGAQGVSAGQTVCLIARHLISAGAQPNSVLTYDVEADSSFVGTSVISLVTNSDMVRVGDNGAIELIKQVCNTTTSSCNVTDGSGFGISNAGAPGDVIQYRIVFRSSSPDGVENIDVFDETPDFSFLKAASAIVVQAPAGMSCIVVTPAGGGSEGYEGALEWQCSSGSMLPGDEGVVAFQVEISN